MSIDLANSLITVARSIQEEVDQLVRPPAEIMPPREEPVLPHSLVKGTRGYLEKIVFQVNACYLATAYDGCAVMIRRLLEVLIIEAFEACGIGVKIKDLGSGTYLLLGDLVPAALSEGNWTLSRTTKRTLAKLKEIGDLSAHSRMYNARRQYIDEIVSDLRVATEEFVYLARLR